MLKRLAPFVALFLLIETLTRFSLWLRELQEVGVTAQDTLKSFGIGLWFDLCVLGFFLLLPALHYVLTPASARGGKADRWIDGFLRLALVFTLLFTTIAEHLFWSEFSTRFNFIAVDYLIYTSEVIGNIVESYPVHWLLLGVFFIALALVWISRRLWPLAPDGQPLRLRLTAFAILASATFAMHSMTQWEWTQFSRNSETNEISANGIYNFFYAFRNNEIDYDKFYLTRDPEEVKEAAYKLLGLDSQGRKLITVDGPMLRKNVMVIVMESMSADYMAAFGNDKNLTPNLDRLAREGVFFTNLYATGTRTVRGLEAVSLSIPPTPGQSILRRPGSENLTTLGSVFADRGYMTQWLYGGYGYFDNMNGFYSSNGYRKIDRADMTPEEIVFANVWGVADESLFDKAIKEADSLHASGKPFFQLIMTTSNHRPYTYPEGRIDIPPKSGRLGGVKYADYSVGKLIDWAKEKPWFKDTIFVFVADHTAGVAGKSELNGKKYQIPMIFYAPNLLKPQRIETLASQIDLAPTLLGVLKTSYVSPFYGQDLLAVSVEPRSFISNYQKVALVKDNALTILAPKRKVHQLSWPDEQPMMDDTPLIDDAVTLYQSASWWRERYQRFPTLPPTPASSP